MSSLRPVSGSPAEILALLREWEAAASPEPVIVQTSGSTGRPKRVVLSREAMRASADATHARLGGPGQWVLNLPPAFVAGVQVLFRSVRAGTEPVLMREGDDLGTAWERVSAERSYLSLVPTQLVRAMHDGSDMRCLARYSAVLLGGGPLDPDVRREAEGSGIRVVQTYGMSETCGGCVYDGIPLDGVEIRIDDGAVLLRGPVLCEGYEGDLERTAAAFRDGWFVTDDLGEVVDGRLRITGRVDDVIISGGVKVPARAVAAAVAAHPAVGAVEVVGVPDPEWGERVVAVVESHSPITLADLRTLVQPREWAPRQLVIVPAIPLLPNGKPDRITIRGLADG